MSSWSVCVSASSTDGSLSDTASLRQILGATSTAQDGLQQTQIARASAQAVTFLGYPVLAQVYSERVAAYGGQTLMLGVTPIRAILRVFDSTTTCEATEYTSTEVWIDDPEAGLLSIGPRGFGDTSLINWNMAPGIVPNSEQKTWLVEYQAGYVYPETSSTAYGTTSTERTLPLDLEAAVLAQSKRLFSNVDPTVLSQSIGDLSITYRSEADGAAGSTTQLQRDLRPWRLGF